MRTNEGEETHTQLDLLNQTSPCYWGQETLYT